MKAIVQRVHSASVTVDQRLISKIGRGILIFAAIGTSDDHKSVEQCAAKVLKMKMWPDEAGVQWKKSVQDMEAEVLCVSQFTLLASTTKGNKPDFHKSAKPEVAKELYDHFYSKVQELYKPERVKNGVFQAMMDVGLVNDGPVCDSDSPCNRNLRYESMDEVVTLEINTGTPKDNPASKGQENEHAASA